MLYKEILKYLPKEMQHRIEYVEMSDFQKVLIQHNIDYDLARPFEYKHRGFFTFDTPTQFVLPLEEGLKTIDKL